jgi:hypothetical protein
MITENEAIRKLYAGSVTFNHNGVIYHGDFEQPTEEQIQAKLAELTAAEPMRQLRQQRDQLLSATDWWVLPDRTPTQAQLDYRQALRDLPANSTPALDENGNLTGVTWPTKPE